MTSGGFLFFAYGEFLDEAKLVALDKRCEVMGLARAEGQRLCFTSAGTANLKPEPNAATWGVMWLVPANRMLELDRWAAARGLDRGVVIVVSPAGPKVPSTAYFNRTAAEGSPKENQLQDMILAAAKLGMSKAYLAELAGWAAKS
jgi:hypothetical protein